MNVDCFIDTNVLVYAAAGDGKGGKAKRRRALELIETQNFALSAQVLQEFYVTVTRKIEIPLPPEKALEWIEQFGAFPCISIDLNLVKIGIEISVRYQTSYWDGTIIAAAEASGATIVFSEDLSDGQYYGSVQILNPFNPLGL